MMVRSSVAARNLHYVLVAALLFTAASLPWHQAGHLSDLHAGHSHDGHFHTLFAHNAPVDKGQIKWIDGYQLPFDISKLAAADTHSVEGSCSYCLLAVGVDTACFYQSLPLVTLATDRYLPGYDVASDFSLVFYYHSRAPPAFISV